MKRTIVLFAAAMVLLLVSQLQTGYMRFHPTPWVDPSIATTSWPLGYIVAFASPTLNYKIDAASATWIGIPSTQVATQSVNTKCPRLIGGYCAASESQALFWCAPVTLWNGDFTIISRGIAQDISNSYNYPSIWSFSNSHGPAHTQRFAPTDLMTFYDGTYRVNGPYVTGGGIYAKHTYAFLSTTSSSTCKVLDTGNIAQSSFTRDFPQVTVMSLGNVGHTAGYYPFGRTDLFLVYNRILTDAELSTWASW